MNSAERGKTAIDPHALYENPDAWGERPLDVPVAFSIRSERFLKSDDDIVAELEQGDAGKFTKARQKAGKFVAVFRAGASHVKGYVAEHPDKIVVGLAGATLIAGAVLLHRTHRSSGSEKKSYSSGIFVKSTI